MSNTVTSWQDTQKLLAFIIVGGFLATVFIWMLHPPSGGEAQMAVLNTLIGFLGGFAASVVLFYFGNTRSAANAQETIKQLSLGQAAPPPATPEKAPTP